MRHPPTLFSTQGNSSLDQQIVKAVKNNNLAEVEQLLLQGADIDAVDTNGDSLLVLAIQRSHLELVNYLIFHQADINSNDARNRQPIQIAIDLSCFGAVKILQNAHIVLGDRYYNDGHIMLCLHNYLLAIKSSYDQSQLSPHIYCNLGYVYLSQNRLEKAEKFFTKMKEASLYQDEKNHYWLHWIYFLIFNKPQQELSVLEKSEIEYVLKNLIEKTKKSDEKILFGRMELQQADSLLKKISQETDAISINAHVMYWRMLIVHYVREENFLDAFEALENLRKSTENSSSFSPADKLLIFDCYQRIDEKTNLDKSLYQAYAPTKNTEENMWVAAATGNLAEVRRLHANNVDIEVVNKNRCTPLILACKYGHIAVVEYILQFNVDLQRSDSSGRSAIHWAEEKGFSEIVQQLITKYLEFAEDAYSNCQIEESENTGIFLLSVVQDERQLFEVYRLLGKCYWVLGKLDVAIEYYSKAIVLKKFSVANFECALLSYKLAEECRNPMARRELYEQAEKNLEQVLSNTADTGHDLQSYDIQDSHRMDAAFEFILGIFGNIDVSATHLSYYYLIKCAYKNGKQDECQNLLAAFGRNLFKAGRKNGSADYCFFIMSFLETENISLIQFFISEIFSEKYEFLKFKRVYFDLRNRFSRSNNEAFKSYSTELFELAYLLKSKEDNDWDAEFHNFCLNRNLENFREIFEKPISIENIEKYCVIARISYDAHAFFSLEVFEKVEGFLKGFIEATKNSSDIVVFSKNDAYFPREFFIKNGQLRKYENFSIPANFYIHYLLIKLYLEFSSFGNAILQFEVLLKSVDDYVKSHDTMNRDSIVYDLLVVSYEALEKGVPGLNSEPALFSVGWDLRPLRYQLNKMSKEFVRHSPILENLDCTVFLGLHAPYRAVVEVPNFNLAQCFLPELEQLLVRLYYSIEDLNLPFQIGKNALSNVMQNILLFMHERLLFYVDKEIASRNLKIRKGRGEMTLDKIDEFNKFISSQFKGSFRSYMLEKYPNLRRFIYKVCHNVHDNILTMLTRMKRDFLVLRKFDCLMGDVKFQEDSILILTDILATNSDFHKQNEQVLILIFSDEMSNTVSSKKYSVGYKSTCLILDALKFSDKTRLSTASESWGDEACESITTLADIVVDAYKSRLAHMSETLQRNLNVPTISYLILPRIDPAQSSHDPGAHYGWFEVLSHKPRSVLPDYRLLVNRLLKFKITSGQLKIQEFEKDIQNYVNQKNKECLQRAIDDTNCDYIIHTDDEWIQYSVECAIITGINIITGTTDGHLGNLLVSKKHPYFIDSEIGLILDAPSIEMTDLLSSYGGLESSARESESVSCLFDFSGAKNISIQFPEKNRVYQYNSEESTLNLIRVQPEAFKLALTEFFKIVKVTHSEQLRAWFNQTLFRSALIRHIPAHTVTLKEHIEDLIKEDFKKTEYTTSLCPEIISRYMLNSQYEYKLTKFRNQLITVEEDLTVCFRMPPRRCFIIYYPSNRDYILSEAITGNIAFYLMAAEGQALIASNGRLMMAPENFVLSNQQYLCISPLEFTREKLERIIFNPSIFKILIEGFLEEIDAFIERNQKDKYLGKIIISSENTADTLMRLSL